MAVSCSASSLIPAEINPLGLQTLLDLLQYAAETFAERPAYTSLGRSITYRELDQLSAAFACYLQNETDLQPGDRIAIQLPNLIQYPIVLFGALRAGLVVVNTNPLYTPSEMLHQFNDSGAVALVILKGLAHQVETIYPQTRLRYLIVTQVADLHGVLKRTLINGAVKYLKKMEPAYDLPQAMELRACLARYTGLAPKPVLLNSGDTAVLQYTGGTTGVAKGAVLSHANLIANILQVENALKPAASHWPDTVIAPLPLYHIYAFTCSQLVLLNGGHNVLIPNPRDLPSLIKVMAKFQATSFLGLNTLFMGLCHQPAFARLDFSRLELTISGGMALTHKAEEQWRAITGCRIVEGYGLSETSPVVTLNPPDAPHIGSIGKSLCCTDVKLIGHEGESVPAGEAGMLCVKGPQVMSGYWQQQQATSEVFTQDGYLITGDIASIDDEGYLHLLDRAKDLIIVSGFNVYPSEVEDVVTSHPDVVECAVVGQPDECCGEVVRLCVVSSNPALEAADLQSWCRTHLAAYKVPKRIDFFSELPKTPVGKVLRRALRAM
ncbi:AMP-binding protein [Neptuniibacter sp. CAU 1671]|uniref:AMP-binding protein n=1 Tax=Neptuniibacter sp. CAU 1671 TaxID=3032593 RepID=UPI0023DBF1B2|nr:AMP-binding protein [Neptuniibacter sp. CAU 1671]MDF2181828.1 AMP-binding protein [Neptuniibacter sp. CAU 1671]